MEKRNIFIFGSTSGIDSCDDGISLHSAARYGLSKKVKSLLEKGAVVDEKNSKGQTPILIAAAYRHKDIVEILLEAGADINHCCYGEWTLMHFVSSNGWLEIAKDLVTREVELDTKNYKGEMPILIAAKNSHKGIVELLLNAGANIDGYSSRKWTLLHHASKKGWLELVWSLVQKGSDLNAKSIDGDVPLLLAAMHSHKDIVELLLNAGANIDGYSSKKWTLLHHASKKGWLELVRSLVQKGSDLNAKSIDGDVPLLLAATNSHKDIVELLISLGANINCYEKDNITVLHCAANYGWLEVVQSLVQKGADPNAKTSRGCTPLFYAVHIRHKDVFELLINSGTNVNCCDVKEWTVLHHISKEGWADVVEFLVQKKGADLNAKTSDGRTPLFLAAENSHEVLVKKLINLGANVNCFDAENWTVLHYASKERWLDIVQSLVKKGANPDVQTSYDYTPLLLASEFRYRDIVELLINLTGNINCCTKDKNWTVLHFASHYGWLEIVISLVEHGADLNVKNYQGLTPLLIAATSRHEGIVKLLIDSEANLNCYGENKWTVLHYASKFGWLDIAQSVVKRGADLNARSDLDDTPLLMAAQYHNTDIVELLINAEADFKPHNKCKMSLLYYALHNGWLQVIRSLARRGVDFNLEIPSGKIPILIAAENCRKDCVQFLIEMGVNVGCCNENQRTVLYYASLYKWPNVVQYVVERVCDVNAKTFFGDTIMHQACRFAVMAVTEHSINASVEIVQFLLKKGADINAKNRYGKTPFVLACDSDILKENHYLLLKFLKYLFSAGADCNIEDTNGRTPFNSISWINNIEVIKLCIENGAYINDRDYYSIGENLSVKEGILQDVKLCSQAIINKFNNNDLPTFYKLGMHSDILPPIEKMKIADNRGIIQVIENTVMWDIKTKGYCNVLEASPIVLSILSVKSFIHFYYGNF